MKKTLKTTVLIKEANEFVSQLQHYAPKLFSQPFYNHKISIEEKVEYIRQIASARSSLFRECAKTYPELYKQNYSVDTDEITYETSEVLTPINK